jgi:hypothetical protein
MSLSSPVEISSSVECHVCGYDVRAQPVDGVCPECRASVAESRKQAAIPRRPAWRDSDRRWRRRMVAGAWCLVFVPLMDALKAWEWDSKIPVPNVFGFPGTVETLGNTFLADSNVFPPLMFFIGITLLFSRERGRRRGPLDWTRRWGIVGSMIILLLSAASLLFITALVMAGIGALFQGLPPKYQPALTQWFVDLSTFYLWYGPQTGTASAVVEVVAASLVVMLACIALFDALRSSGSKRAALILLSPLAILGVLHVVQLGRSFLAAPGTFPTSVYGFGLYFRPQMLVRDDALFSSLNLGSPVPFVSGFVVELVKWLTMVVIALWLSVAQILARSRRAESAQNASSNRPDPSNGGAKV